MQIRGIARSTQNLPLAKLQKIKISIFCTGKRQFSSGGHRPNNIASRSILLGSVAVGGAYALYKTITREKKQLEDVFRFSTVQAATIPESQPSVSK